MMNNENINYEKLDKKRLIELLDKANGLLMDWTEAVVSMGAELFIICPQHEIFKKDYFNNNTKMMILRRALQMVNLCKYDRIIYQKDGSGDFIHNIEAIERILQDKAKEMKDGSL